MSPWEIILIVLLSVIIVLLVLGVIVYDRFKELMRKQRVGFVLQDEFAGEAPIVFLGDSLTDFYPTGEFYSPYNVANRGIACDTTAARRGHCVASKSRVFADRHQRSDQRREKIDRRNFMRTRIQDRGRARCGGDRSNAVISLSRAAEKIFYRQSRGLEPCG